MRMKGASSAAGKMLHCFVFNPTLTGGKIVEIEAVADPVRLRQLQLAVFDD